MPLASTKYQSSYCMTYRNTSVVATGVSVKGAATELQHINCTNTTSSVNYLQLYNKATAPTVGTDTPVMTLSVPANSSTGILDIDFNDPVYFSLGLGIAITTTATGSSAPATGSVINLLYR